LLQEERGVERMMEEEKFKKDNMKKKNEVNREEKIRGKAAAAV
jgi:hypothetical protein